MSPNTEPAQIPHNLHYSSAKADTAPRLSVRHAIPDTGLKLVGAVGIENNNGRDFKDLCGIRRNTKSLKGNDGEREGILIAPLKLPRFSCPLNFLAVRFNHCLNGKSAEDPNLAAWMASRQTDSISVCLQYLGASAFRSRAKAPTAQSHWHVCRKASAGFRKRLATILRNTRDNRLYLFKPYERNVGGSKGKHFGTSLVRVLTCSRGAA
jgi:hypothetical protein